MYSKNLAVEHGTPNSVTISGAYWLPFASVNATNELRHLISEPVLAALHVREWRQYGAPLPKKAEKFQCYLYEHSGLSRSSSRQPVGSLPAAGFRFVPSARLALT